MEYFITIRNKLFPLGFNNDFKILISSSLPIIFSNLSQTLLPIISLIFCGHLGEDELDGVSLANSFITIFVLSVIYGMASACDTFFPQIFGGQDKKKMGIMLQKSLIIGLITVFISGTMILNSKYLMFAFVDSIQVAKIADKFLLIYIPSILFYTIAIILGKYIQSQNIIYPVMVINFIAIIADASLQAIFVYVFELGVVGSAIAVDIATFLLAILIFSYIYYTKAYVQTWTGWSKDSLYDWKMFLRLAIPGLFSIIIEISNFEVGILCASSIDNKQLALTSIAMQVTALTFQIPYGIAIASNIYIGHLLGSGKPDDARNASRVAYAITWMISFCIFLVIISCSSIIPLIFTNSKDIQDSASTLLKFIAVIHLLDSTQGTGAGILRSVGAQFYSSIFFFVAFYCTSLPIGLCLLFLTPLRVYGFYIGVFIGLIVLIILQFIYILRIDWNKKSIEAVDLSAPIDEDENDEKISIIETRQLIKEQDGSSFKKQFFKKFAFIMAAFGIFILSFYLHEIKSFDDEIDANITNISTTFFDI